MKKVKIIIFIISIFILTGCWNYNELNELAIISGVSVDKENGEYVINYMISNSSKNDSKSSANTSGTVLYEGIGSTMTKATESINQKLPKVPYISHAEIIIISEEIARYDVLNTMDFLLRDPESRKEIYLLVSKNISAKDTLSILTPLESFPSENIKSNITSSPYESATTSTVKYSKFLSHLIERGIEPSLGVIEVEGNVEKGQKQESNDQARQEAVIKLTSTAMFKKDKLVYITSEEESIAVNILNKRLNNTYIKVKCGDSNAMAYLTSLNVNSEIKLENGNPLVKVKVDSEGSLIEVNCKVNIEDKKVIKELKKSVEEELKSLLTEGIKSAKKYKTDIFGFGNLLYKKNPKYWSSVEKKWNDEIFPNLPVEIDIDVSLSSKGSLEQSIKEEIK